MYSFDIRTKSSQPCLTQSLQITNKWFLERAILAHIAIQAINDRLNTTTMNVVN
jgi:hypothetical protein